MEQQNNNLTSEMLKEEIHLAKTAPVNDLINEAIYSLHSIKAYPTNDMVRINLLRRMERIIVRFGVDDMTEKEILSKMDATRRGAELLSPAIDRDSQN